MRGELSSFHWPYNWQTVLALCLASWSANGAIRADEFETVSGRAMGTSYCLKFSSDGLRMNKEDLAVLVSEEFERLESIFSLYRPESEISRLNAAPSGEWIQVSEDLYAVAKYAAELWETTEGAFDPTIKPLAELWRSEPLSGAWKPPSQDRIEAALGAIGASHLQFQVHPLAIKKDAVQLDLNALVEGWAIARILERLKLNGCTSALFELGGEYSAIGHKSDGEPWRVGIEDPQELTKVYATLRLNDEAVCTSGVYRQARSYAGKQYSHLIDPRTGYPVTHDCLSVSVIHSNAMIADGWATALMVLGPEKGMELANKFGLVASFACRSASSISPRVSQLADGKIMPTQDVVQSNWQASRYMFAGVVFSFAVLVWFLSRKLIFTT